MIPRGEQYVLAMRTAVVSGALAMVVAAMLLADYSTRTAKDPLNTAEFLALKAQLRAAPQDASLHQSLRTLDRELREAWFDRRRFAQWGAWLLLGSVALCLAAARAAVTLRRQLPNPRPLAMRDDPEEVERRASRWSVAGLAAAAAILALIFYAGFPGHLPRSIELHTAEASLPPGESLAESAPPAPAAGPAAPSAGPKMSAGPATSADPTIPAAPGAISPQTDSPVSPEPVAAGGPQVPAASDLPELPDGVPSDQELQQNWPVFRGPAALGLAPTAQMPGPWNGASGEGILWKSPVPLPGNNSPVVWNDRIFLTGADEQVNEVYCFAGDSGELLWKRPLPKTAQTPAEVPEVMEATGLAASTAAADGRRVYAIFANGELAAFDFDGHLRWQRSLGLPKNAYGHASSLSLYGDLLLVQFDQGTKKDGLSRLLALRTGSGETAWEAPREVPNSWPSPLVIRVGDQPQIITCADPWVIAYAPADGSEIWRAKCLQGDVGPSPTFAAGVLFAANEFPGVTALRADGTGDVTDSHVIWEADLGVPDCCSPVATEEFVFLAASYGILTCYDAREGGEPLWEQEFEDASFVSSPVLVGAQILLFDEKGRAWLVQPTREECRVVGEYALGEDCVTTPAFRQGRMYVRGKEHLFCIGTASE